MKTKYIILGIIVVVALWIYYKYKKGDIKVYKDQPRTKEGLIQAIKEKNNALFEQLASLKNIAVEELDYSYLEEKGEGELRRLLSLSQEAFANEVYSDYR